MFKYLWILFLGVPVAIWVVASIIDMINGAKDCAEENQCISDWWYYLEIYTKILIALIASAAGATLFSVGVASLLDFILEV